MRTENEELIRRVDSQNWLPTSTVAKARWLRDNEPENAESHRYICLPHDYLTWCFARVWTGESKLDELDHRPPECLGHRLLVG